MSSSSAQSMSWIETVLGIFWSGWHTPTRSLMDRTICDFSRTYVWAWGGMNLVRIVHVRRKCRWRKRVGGGGVSAGQTCSVHFITLPSPRGQAVCRSSELRAPDDQMSATPVNGCYWSPHLVLWTTSEHDESRTRRRDESHTVQNCLFCSANFLPFSSSHSLRAQVAILHCPSTFFSVSLCPVPTPPRPWPHSLFDLPHRSFSVSAQPLKMTRDCVMYIHAMFLLVFWLCLLWCCMGKTKFQASVLGNWIQIGICCFSH